MRNLSQYPITAEEVMEVVKKIPEVNPPGTPGSAMRIGGLGDMIRRGIIEHFENPEHMSAVLAKLAR
ncbi:hypothetical protein MINTM005_12880 [Mycobacterium intracellulare]|uniref:hypothetical protein n=1 Tax=Mycobacterium intracellulare TaxID=1767 RepID=UPI0019269E91|nr:hypothetical protein [Mycobacterium intracellulare]BCO56044.1 hypothetical protein MINTM005_12880 [Mycobacterium intracellulare]